MANNRLKTPPAIPTIMSQTPYLVRLSGADPTLFVSLDARLFTYHVSHGTLYTLSHPLPDTQALQGTLIDGRLATIGDLRSGRAKDISFATKEGRYWNLQSPPGMDSSFVHMIYLGDYPDGLCGANTYKHADRLRNLLVNL